MSSRKNPIAAFLPKELLEGPSLEGIKELPLSEIVVRGQARKHFDENALLDLAESIRSYGVLEPLLVREDERGRYELISGERRYRAAQMAGLDRVPVLVLDVDEKEAWAITLVENLQRENLSPYEETLGILDLLALRLNKSVEDVVSLLYRMRDEARGRAPQNVLGGVDAGVVLDVFVSLGRMSWESFVQSRLPLLNLPADLREALEEGAISYTVALELKKIKDDEERGNLLREAKAGLSIREIKRRVRELLSKPKAEEDWYQQLIRKIKRLDALPTEKRQAVEEHLKAIAKLMED